MLGAMNRPERMDAAEGAHSTAHSTIMVNGTELAVAPGTTVSELVARWCPSPVGIAVARNREVVPRSAWPTTGITADDVVEIVSAAAGG